MFKVDFQLFIFINDTKLREVNVYYNVSQVYYQYFWWCSETFFICEGSDLELTVQHGCGLGVNLTLCYNHMAIDLFTVPPACKNFL